MSKDRDANHSTARKASKEYSFKGLAGCVIQRRNMQTGFLVGIYNSAQAGMENDPALPWVTVCEEHDSLVGHSSLFLAREHVSDPEVWCEACRRGHMQHRTLRSYVRVDGDKTVLVSDKNDATLIETEKEFAALLNRQEPGKVVPTVLKELAGYPVAQFEFVRLTRDETEALERSRMG